MLLLGFEGEKTEMQGTEKTCPEPRGQEAVEEPDLELAEGPQLSLRHRSAFSVERGGYKHLTEQRGSNSPTPGNTLRGDFENTYKYISNNF